MTELATSALCEDHPDAERATCARCGDFLCVVCAPVDAPPRCATCRVRYGIEDVPWEVRGPSMPKRWTRTARAFVLRPTRTLERTRPEGAWPALRFLLHTWVITVFAVWIVSFVRALSRGGLDGRALAPPVLLGLALGGMTVLRMGLFHGVSRLLGGSGGWRTSVASVAYLQAVLLVYAPVSLSMWVPSLSPLVLSLTALSVEAFLAVNLTTAARLRHALSPARAAVAAWSLFVCVLLAGFGCGFFGLLIDASALPS